MTATTRSETIGHLEVTIAGCAELLAKALLLNEYMRRHRLPLPLYDVTAIYATQMLTEVMLKEMELRAVVTG